jgi:hypothetical protein
MASDGKEPVLDFMVVRAPDRVPDPLVRRRYIRDRYLYWKRPPETHLPDPNEPDPQAVEVVSAIGKLVHEMVFVSKKPPTPESYDLLLNNLLALLRPSYVPDPTATTPPPTNAVLLRLDDLALHAHIRVGDLYYLLPDRLDVAAASVPLIAQLLQARPLLEATARAADPSTFDPARLRQQLEGVFGQALHVALLSETGHSPEYATAHRALFDGLYLLYLLRRWVKVDLSDIMDGLQLLHALTSLAVDSLYAAIRSGSSFPADAARAEALANAMPELAGWDGSSEFEALPLVRSAADLARLLDARPIVNPLFTRLFWLQTPFNEVAPIGVGDLKVVQQWLTAYLPGEISHIHNIMKGEQRTRAHRRTERSEEVFSLSTSRAEDTTRDTQSTERFEVKAEAENVVKSSLNVTVNASLTYDNKPAMITASAGAGFGYTNASEDHTKTAENFARDVIDKVVERVQTQTASQRTVTQLFETEERNQQTFNNVKGSAHVSGMYRWVDKEYTAQVFNYGKRMMFEFVIPQPAAFWVESTLRANQNSLDVPQPPFPEPVKPTVNLGFVEGDIDEALFASMKVKYDLRHIPPYPLSSRASVPVRQNATRSREFEEDNISGADHVAAYGCSIVGGVGYRITGASITGRADFHNQQDANRISWLINDLMVHAEQRDMTEQWPLALNVGAQENIVLDSEDVTLALVFNNDAWKYNMQIAIDLERTPATLLAWQRLVYDTVFQIESERLAKDYEQERMAYEAALSEYRNRLAQIKAQTIGELLAGGSDAANRQVIDEEIRKHCLTMLTKEFDTVEGDDVLSNEETVGTRTVETQSYVRTVTEAKKADEKTTVGYTKDKLEVDYPAINIEKTRKKGSVVQFLEQAFEWQRISYVFYPYFWANEIDWIELMNRGVDADPTFTAFLRSGMARVLIAATPQYEDSILHYLDTREPWEGGPSPVIGDPLYVALHDELREQTDDRASAEPEGTPWTFIVPTSLVYLHGSEDKLPDISAEREARAPGGTVPITPAGGSTPS